MWVCFGFVFAVWDMPCFDFCEDDIVPVDSRKCRKSRLFAFEPINDTFVSNGLVGGVYLKPSKIFFIAFRVDKRYFRAPIDFSANSGICRNYRSLTVFFFSLSDGFFWQTCLPVRTKPWEDFFWSSFTGHRYSAQLPSVLFFHIPRMSSFVKILFFRDNMFWYASNSKRKGSFLI